MSPRLPRLTWRQLHFRRPIGTEGIVQVLRLWAHDPGHSYVVLECRVVDGQVRYYLGSPKAGLHAVTRIVTATMPGTQTVELSDERKEMRSTVTVKVRGSERPLRRDAVEVTVPAILAAACSAGSDVVVQLILGERRPARPLVEKNRVLDPASKRAAREKAAEPSFGCVIRLGSSHPAGRSLGQMFQALSTLQSAGVHMRAWKEPVRNLNHVLVPWRWSQHLNIDELAALTVWPVGDGDLPGVASLHPVPLAPTSAANPLFVVGEASAPGHDKQLVGLDLRASLRHVWLIGPPGTGKSELLAGLALDTARARHGQAVIEPKGDLCWSIVTRLKTNDGLVILDPTDPAPLGLNPLVGGDPDVRAEAVLAIFTRIFGDAIGPRSRDVLHHALLTMTRRGDLSLPMLPLLLTNAAFRRTIVPSVVADDPLSLAAFWSWFEHLSEAERSSVVAPVLNKVRILTTNRYLRAVLGQHSPRISIRQILREGKTLLVPLQAGVIGNDAARVLGSLVASQIFTATAERANLPEEDRRPFFATIDELHQYVGGADFAEAMALFRGYKTGLRVAHQHLGQLPREVKEALLQTARSRVVFQTGHHDARELAQGHPELLAEDITALGAFEVYASLMQGNTTGRYVSVRTQKLPPATSSLTERRATNRTRYGQSRELTEAKLVAAMAPGKDGADRVVGRIRRPS